MDHTYDQSTLVQVMAWCHQATSHYLSQCWPRFLSPYGVTKPERVKRCSTGHITEVGTMLNPGECHSISWFLAVVILPILGSIWQVALTSWWHHQMETFFTSLALCAGNSPVTGEFPSQRPVTHLMFSLICAWVNGWVKNHEAGDLRRSSSHYDVTVMYSNIGFIKALHLSFVQFSYWYKTIWT